MSQINSKDRTTQIKWEEEIKCNFCKSTNKEEYLVDETKRYLSFPLRLVECRDCNLVFQEPRPTFETLLRRIRGNILGGKEIFMRKLNRNNVNTIHRKIIEKTIKTFDEDGKPETLFDMGFGAGTIMEEGLKLGLEVFGNEINPYSVSYYKDKEEYTVFGEPTINLKINKKFDIITCLDYIEHTYNPNEDLKWIYDHLTKNGRFYLKTLWLGCPNHLEQGEKWNLFDTCHFYYYYPRVLLDMITKSNLEVIDVLYAKAIIHVIGGKL